MKGKIDMKKIICFITAICMTLTLAACGGAESEARETFESMMNAFKSCDKTQINKYYGFDKLTSYIEAEEGEFLSDAVLGTLSEMDYKVNSAEKVNSTAVKLNVEITTVDFSKIMNNYIEKVTALVASPEYQAKVRTMDDSEYKSLMAAQMIDCIEESGKETVTKTTDVTMIKSESGWSLGGNSDDFLGVLFENLSNAVEALV